MDAVLQCVIIDVRHRDFEAPAQSYPARAPLDCGGASSSRRAAAALTVLLRVARRVWRRRFLFGPNRPVTRPLVPIFFVAAAARATEASTFASVCKHMGDLGGPLGSRDARPAVSPRLLARPRDPSTPTRARLARCGAALSSRRIATRVPARPAAQSPGPCCAVWLARGAALARRGCVTRSCRPSDCSGSSASRTATDRVPLGQPRIECLSDSDGSSASRTAADRVPLGQRRIECLSDSDGSSASRTAADRVPLGQRRIECR